MKLLKLIVTLALAASASAFAADVHNHAHAHEPLHGGIVSEVKDVDYELVAKPDVIQLYLRDHGKPVDVSKASAKLTLLVGAGKQTVDLKPAGGKLESIGKYNVAAGAKAIAVVYVPGKQPATVRFAWQ